MNRLSRFISETSEKGHSGLLPVNLSNEWLEILIKQAEELLSGRESDAGGEEIVAAIIILLQAKNGGPCQVEISWEEMFKYVDYLNIELNLELISRNTEIMFNSATLETILTERSVEMSAEEIPLDPSR